MFKKLFKILSDRQKKFFFIILFLTLVNAIFEVISIATILPFINLIIKDNSVTESGGGIKIKNGNPNLDNLIIKIIIQMEMVVVLPLMTAVDLLLVIL